MSIRYVKQQNVTSELVGVEFLCVKPHKAVFDDLTVIHLQLQYFLKYTCSMPFNTICVILTISHNVLLGT